MKVGDKIICKKELDDDFYIFRIYKEYTISDIEKNHYFITYDKPGMLGLGCWMDIHKLKKYFYTKEEIRKMKLESL